MNKIEQAYGVMLKTRDQLIGEIAAAGQAGGTGRAQNYAPVLAYVCKCIAELQSLMAPQITAESTSENQYTAGDMASASADGFRAGQAAQPSFADKMKAARAAKKATKPE